MFDSFSTSMATFFNSLPFSPATWFVVFVLGFVVWLFAKANKDTNSHVKWDHLVVDTSTNRTSPYKLGYLVGMIVATWIVVKLTDTDKITYDVFGLYLAYLLGGAGWNSFIKNRPTKSIPEVPAGDEEVK